MQKRKHFLAAALVSLTFVFTGSFAVAQVTGHINEINTTVYDDVSGNTNGTNQPITIGDLDVPMYTDIRDVDHNQVIIRIGGDVVGITYGGLTYGGGSVTYNKVTIESGGQASDAVFGGRIYNSGSSSDVAYNKVTIEASGTANSRVYGGYSVNSGKVIGNIVEISGEAAYYTFGGYAYGPAAVTENEVIVKTGGKTNNIYGGMGAGQGAAGTSGEVTYNKIVIETLGEVQGDAIGGYTAASSVGLVKGNSVTVKSYGKVNNSVYGGWAMGAGDVTKNTVIIGDYGIVGRDIYGGYSTNDGDISANAVSVGYGASARNVYGGWSETAGSAGNVENNEVVVNGSVEAVIGGYNGGDGNASGNSVTVDYDGTTQGVAGGVAYGDATDNTVIVRGQSTGPVYGGLAYLDGVVTGNSVEIFGITTGDVYGGFSIGNGDLSGNSVTVVSGGEIFGNVYGGFSNGSGTVSGNAVNVTSTAILTNAALYGFNSGAVGYDNTLNVTGFNSSMVTMGNFDTYNFVLGKLDSNLTFITITGAAVDIDGATINISFTPTFFQDNTINSGDVITVISSITSNSSPYAVNVNPSPFLHYNYRAVYDANALQLIISSTLSNAGPLLPQTEAVGQGFAAGLAFLGQAADVRSSLYFVPQSPRFIPFAKMVYGKQYISTGSNINVKGFSAIAGLALNTNFDNGSHLVVGAFVEGGWGDYDSRNAFSNSTTIKGKGDTEYYGGGVLARYALKSGLYSEGTFAAGKTETDFKTRDFTPGTTTKYDYSVPYYSAHLAVGQVLNLGSLLNLDIYGKYLWTRQNGDNVTVDGYRFKFKEANSHRLRAGGKLQADVSPQLQPYVGGAYEYEFSGRIKGSLDGMNLGKPSLRGSTGIGQLGLVWLPTEFGNLKVDLGAQGYVGKREGVSGGLTITMSF